MSAENTRTNEEAERAYARAEELIEEARREGSEELNLSRAKLGFSLNQLPPLTNLPALKKLNVFGHQIKDGSILSELEGLEWLDLACTKISNAEPLAWLTRLQTLNLSFTQVSDYTLFTNLTNLQNLDLSGNRINDVSHLNNLTKLKTLNLRVVRVSDIKPLSSLTTLEALNLRDTQVSDVTPLANLIRLQNLNLHDTSVSNIKPLSSLASLEVLNLRDTQVSDVTPLTNLSNLQSLDLCGSKVSDITRLTRLTNLLNLQLSNIQVSDATLFANLTNIQELGLFGTQINDVAPLADLNNLHSLHLNGNPISNIAPLAKLKNLQVLGLTRTKVSDLGPLASIDSLRILMIDNLRLLNAPRALFKNLHLLFSNTAILLSLPTDLPWKDPQKLAKDVKAYLEAHPEIENLASKDGKIVSSDEAINPDAKDHKTEPFVFLSYSNQDQDYAWQVVEALRGQGAQVWWDRDIPPGQNWREEIEKRLSNATQVVALFTEAGAASGPVREEAQAALKAGKLLPLNYRGRDLPYGFNEANWVDARDLSTEEVVGLILERFAAASPNPAPTPALNAAYEAEKLREESPTTERLALGEDGMFARTFATLSNAKIWENAQHKVGRFIRRCEKTNQLSSYVSDLAEDLELVQNQADPNHAILYDSLRDARDNILAGLESGDIDMDPQLRVLLLQMEETVADMGTALPELKEVEKGRAAIPIKDQSADRRQEFDSNLEPLPDLAEPKFFRPDMIRDQDALKDAKDTLGIGGAESIDGADIHIDEDDPEQIKAAQTYRRQMLLLRGRAAQFALALYGEANHLFKEHPAAAAALVALVTALLGLI